MRRDRRGRQGLLLRAHPRARDRGQPRGLGRVLARGGGRRLLARQARHEVPGASASRAADPRGHAGGRGAARRGRRRTVAAPEARRRSGGTPSRRARRRRRSSRRSSPTRSRASAGRSRDVDKYATELHNPELTEPSGSGDVPLLNYRVIGGLAALAREIAPAEVPASRGATGCPASRRRRATSRRPFRSSPMPSTACARALPAHAVPREGQPLPRAHDPDGRRHLDDRGAQRTRTGGRTCSRARR